MFRKSLVAAALASSLVFISGVAQADFITLNPSAANTGCLDLNGAACGAVSAGTAAFSTDNVGLDYRGVLDIALNRANSIAGGFMGASTYKESGNLRFESFELSNVDVTEIADINRAVGGTYDIYGTFLLEGLGLWVSATTFITSTISSFTVKLFASPNGGTTQTIVNPSSGVDASGGVTFGSEDFLLGTASIVADPTNFGQASINTSNGKATTSIVALLDFNPAPGTQPPNGFFQAPDPFNINIGSQAGSEATDTVWAANGLGVRITTVQNGGGSLSFEEFTVPEPSALALTGLALVALGFSRRRKVTAQ